MRAIRLSPAETLRLFDRLEAALEASCAALVAVRCTQAHPTELDGNLDDVTEEIVRTISRLREAIADLRSVSGEQSSALASGFVLGTDGESSAETQVRPRRTA
jgi:hypothetical protein